MPMPAIRISFFLLLLLGLIAGPAWAQLPEAPINLAASVSGSTVTLTWSAPATGGVPTGYVVDAAFTPGGPTIATLPVAGTSLVVPNVPPGQYFVRVSAVNSAGRGAPSNEVIVSVGGTGCPGPPQPPQNVRFRAVGLAATVSWTPPTIGCGATGYILLAGSAPGASDIAQVNLGGQLGLSATAPPGTYFVRVVSVNQFGMSAPSPDLRARIAVNHFTDTLQPLQAVAFDLTLSSSGSYLGVLDWADPTVDLDLFLTTPGCPYPPGGCLLVASRARSGNTEQVAWMVSTGETYRLWVDNFSSRVMSFTIENFVGGAGTPVGPSASPTGGSR